jgi:hypothetical protein
MMHCCQYKDRGSSSSQYCHKIQLYQHPQCWSANQRTLSDQRDFISPTDCGELDVVFYFVVCVCWSHNACPFECKSSKWSDLDFNVWVQKLVLLVVSGREEPDLVRASAGAVLARVFVQNSAFFAQLTSQPSLSLALQQSGVAVPDQSALFLFFDAWLDKVTFTHVTF